MNMPTSKVAPAYLSVRETPAKEEREIEGAREPSRQAGEPANALSGRCSAVV